MPSSNIDKRIVEMEFDNQRFEKNVNQSISTLDRLKNALNLNDAAKGFSTLEKQANSIDFTGLEKSISNIEHRFSVLGIAGATVISNITNKAIGAVSKINGAIFGQMKSGGISRALNLEHANFMMQGLLKDSAKVAEIMATDGPVQKSVRGTAYGLDAAASAAAQFLASGVTDLGKLENALTGISGVASMAGSSFEDIASIFTTVAGQGKVMTMQLRQLEARSLNPAATLAEHLNKSEAEIREMVSKGKIDFETFAEAMNEAFGDQAKKANETFTGAMANVKAALSRIGAKVAAPTIEELRKVFVDLIAVVDNASKALDPFIEDINIAVSEIGNLTRSLLENEDLITVFSNGVGLLRNVIAQIILLVDPIRKAFKDVFPAKSLKDIAYILDLFRRMTNVFYLSGENSDKLARVFRGLFSIADLVGQAISAIVRVMLTYSNEIGSFMSNMLGAAASVGDFFTGVDMWVRENDIFYNALMKIIDVVRNFKAFITNSFEDISKVVTPVLRVLAVKFIELKWSIEKLEGSVNILDKIKERFSGLTSIGKVLSAVFDGIKAVFKEVSPIFKAFADYVGNGIATLFTGIAEVVRSGRGFEGFLDLINTVLIGGIGVGITKFIDQIVNLTKKSNTLIGNISWTFRELANSLSVMQAKVKADMLASIAKSVGILTLSIIGLSLIDSDKLLKALAAISLLMGVLVASRVALAKFIPVAEALGNTWYEKIMHPFSESIRLAAQSDALVSLATAVGILAASLKLISTIDDKKMDATLGAFIILIGGLVGSAILIDKYTEQLPKLSGAFIALSASMLILAKALGILSKQKPEDVLTSVGALAAMLFAISTALNKVKAPEGGSLMVTAGAITMIALAIGSLAPGLALLSAMNPLGLASGVAALASMLAVISVSLYKLKGGPDLMWTASAISLIALAIGSLAPGLALLSAMNPLGLASGVAALASMLAVISVSLYKLKGGPDLMWTASAISLIALAIGSLAPGLALLSAMDPLSVALGVAALASMLLAIGTALTVLKGGPDLMWIAGSITVIALALNMLAPTIAMLGILPWQVLAKGVLTLAGALAAFVVSAIVISKLHLELALLILADAMIKMGASVGLVGAGLFLIASALGIIGVSGVAAAAGLTAIMMAIGGALPMLLTGLATGIAAFIVSLGAMAGAISTALGQLIGSVSKAFALAVRLAIPAWVETVKEVGTAILNAINELAPLFINTVLNLIESLLAALNEHAEAIILGLTELFITIINGVATAIEQYAEPLADAWIHLFTVVLDVLIAKVLPKFLDFGLTMIGEIGKGMVQATAELGKMLVSIGAEILKSLGVPEEWVDKGVELINGFIDGIASMISTAIETITEFGKNIIDAICKVFDINSPSKIFEWIAEMCTKGAQNGIENNQDGPIGAVETMGNGMIDMLESKLSTAEGVAEGHANNLTSILDRVNKTLYGITSAQRKSNAAEDQKRADMRGYNNIDALTRAGQAGQIKLVHKSTKATEEETAALDKNTKATGGSSKAKKKNEEANKKKTKEIKEETDALDEESEAVEENTIDYQALAEEIEVVTEKFNEDLNWQGLKTGNKILKSLSKALSTFWSTDFSKNDINQTFESVKGSLKSTADYVAKGTYRFNDSDKLIKKLSTSTMLSSKKIKKEVEATGRTVVKVFEGQMKVFRKNQNGIEKFTLAVPKSTKNLAKFAKQALNFSKSLEGINVENIGDSKTLIENLRGIEKYFVKFKDASKSAQGYMKQVFSAFDEAGFRNSMNILGKNIDGVGNIMSKNSKATAYVEDAFISLAATLYDGSEAANEYATEHARLLFLLEHGEATEEEVAEHERAYIKRITDALVEYRNTLVDTLQSQMDIWKEFDKGTIEGGAETLLKNIESQIAGYQNWGNMLMELSKRGVDKDLMKTLTDEGVKSYGKLEAMLQMTREQLALFNQDFKLSQQMIEQTADTALAAMANATTRASQRAAAEKGNKVAQAQLKMSKKTAKQMKEEYEAVAKAVVTTDKVTKKQEKEYLKTLTKKERQEYKKAKKELKAAEAEEKRLAEQERARIAEENRLKTVLDSIKTMDDYIKVITEYNNDSAVMTNITNKMSEAFKDMGGVISNISVSTGDANDAFLMFAETLDATGQDGLNYFEEMAARVKKFTDEIKDSITGVNYLTTAFGTASKIKMADIYDNGMSNIIGNLKTSYQLDQLAKKGYNSYVLQDVINTWKSDKAQGLELITELIDADAAYVEAFNAMTEERLRMSTEISDKMTGAAASAKSKKAIETEVTKRRTALNEITNARIAAEQEVGSIQARINAANTRNQEVAERKRLIHLNNLGAKRTKAQTKDMKSLYKKIFGKKWKEGVVFSFTTQDVTPTDTSGMYWELANANAKVNELRAEETEKTRLLNEELAVLADYNAKLEVARKKLLADAKVRIWFENATTSINDFYEALKKVNKGSSEYIYAVGKIADVMKEFTAPIAVFNLEENFKSIKEQAKGIELPAEIKTVEDGLMKFGETLVDVTEDSDQFWASMKQGLIDYQKELKNTIASSSDFFSMFEPDTDTTANDYLEYADSQIEGLKNWQEYLKKIADMGLDKEIVEKFASQGLSSYTQVSAWANATAEQIGEYNQLWKDYNESVESASNSAMASIAAAWSTAGQALQDSMTNMFNNGGAERLRQVGYEASAMVITGVQDGIGGVLPTIISAIEKTSSESAVTTAVGKKIGTAINDGLVQAITTSVTNTVDTVIEKFKMAVDSVNNYANEVLQTEYTITIHVDASEMDAAIARMNAAISGTNVIANETSQAVTSSKASNTPETDTTVQTPAVTNNVTYNQTINSPTAMNQVEIYRESQAVANQIKSTIALANG